VIEAAKEAIGLVRQRGGTVSFDPNIRKEMLQPAMREALGWMVRHCDVFLPSGAELTLLTAATDEESASANSSILGSPVSLRSVGRRGRAITIEPDNSMVQDSQFWSSIRRRRRLLRRDLRHVLAGWHEYGGVPALCERQRGAVGLPSRTDGRDFDVYPAGCLHRLGGGNGPMSTDILSSLAPARVAGSPKGITSVCSAHPVVIEAALWHGKDTGGTVLVEATCNQVNQEGGYTGMTPAAFRDHVYAIAERIGLAPGRIILGGDHLGPNPWRRLPAEEALRRAETMVVAYVEAGYENFTSTPAWAATGGKHPAG